MHENWKNMMIKYTKKLGGKMHENLKHDDKMYGKKLDSKIHKMTMIGW